MYSVLFICTANICRSPLALGIMRNLVNDEVHLWDIDSAGTWTVNGEPAATNTLAVLAERGVDLTDHRSQGVMETMLDQYNLILTMERGHKEALRVEFARNASKIFLLSEMVGRSYDIKDPIGRPIEEFQLTASEMESILTRGLPRIRELAADPQAEAV